MKTKARVLITLIAVLMLSALPFNTAAAGTNKAVLNNFIVSPRGQVWQPESTVSEIVVRRSNHGYLEGTGYFEGSVTGPGLTPINISQRASFHFTTFDTISIPENRQDDFEFDTTYTITIRECGFMRFGGYDCYGETVTFTLKQPEPINPISPVNGVQLQNPITFQWYENDGATSYKLQINDLFGNVIWSHDLPKNEYCGIDICTFETRLPLAVYQWSVAGVFPGGIVGPFSPIRAFNVVDVFYPEEVTPVSPQQGDVFTQNQILFQWEPSNYTDYFVLTIYDVGSFEIPIETACKNQVTEKCSYEITLENGEYAWSIYGVNEHGAGPTGDKFGFAVDNMLESKK